MTKIFIDGSSGTTGLRLRERLAGRDDIELITLPDSLRKDTGARKSALNEADIVFLCLPDDAAREAVSMIENPDTAVIDTSTAHRTNDLWTYGFPEITGAEKIRASKRIANPGCHASGFIALVAPLIREGLLKEDVKLSAFSLTGYTGGGKKMIAEYENKPSALFDAPRQYALGQTHKHIPEMQKICGLSRSPCFCPVVADFPCGMEVTIPLFADEVKGTVKEIADVYRGFYTGRLVSFNDADEQGFLSAGAYSGFDNMGISVYGNEERLILVSRFDNLGKGASGAAIQNMNILLGDAETKGLTLKEKL
ncbi:MAG TPA: N-acetyl-gamma-glutamyl-phosphate reductase [Methanocorpusculum sp.]|nr:N-acetyl-gamma-glutamyl-phosphate reductase [Methanocorpusculum sp.]HJJ59670.1 N-acetyl-gamma-glutamyl-phosphate reductase [Methanocorpusculum sp.]